MMIACLAPCASAATENHHVAVSALLCEQASCSPVTLLVWDGDNFILRDERCGREKIRIENIDAPEIDGRCAAERVAAAKAKNELARLLAGHRIKVVRSKLDRYGRQLALVVSDAGDVGERLVEQDLVRRWDSWRASWCRS
ncbi:MULTISPECIES: thermonuclease family protein [Rhizobiaceae]|uniref:thermonuclease family protein n=1 Tax=Rhizobiaceae TaxID=82115 RepID=UPI0003C5313A|nr:MULTISPECIES: thermonuclease family protein [Hyphomicrobiales]EYR78502.1 thermonuclease-like protein [Shinella sp. DD12]MCA0345268.1 thermonuclease family protein [Pseudomonadota bacterium]VVS99056.1 Thermonuclease-like protein [Hoeflea sp. EC-HK425]